MKFLFEMCARSIVSVVTLFIISINVPELPKFSSIIVSVVMISWVVIPFYERVMEIRKEKGVKKK